MRKPFALLGFGEAGQGLAHAGGWADAAHVFDIKTNAPDQREALRSAYLEAGVLGADSPAAAMRDAAFALSLVTADQAYAAALSVSPHIKPGALYFDFNSVAPHTKRACADAIKSAGGRYVDVALMAPVRPAWLATPLLLSGPEDAVTQLAGLGFTAVRRLGEDIGHASSVKMVRSIYVKGVEAVTAECLLAAFRAGVLDEVIASLGAGAKERLAYNMERMANHGVRRAAEMREVCAMLNAIGAADRVTQATIAWQTQIGAMGGGELALDDLLRRACAGDGFRETAE